MFIYEVDSFSSVAKGLGVLVCYWTRKDIDNVELSETDLNNLKLIDSLWKADNAIGLAILLNFDNRKDDNFNNRRIRSATYWIEKFGRDAEDYIEDENKYYFRELTTSADLEKGLSPFFEVTNDKLLCLLGEYFSINVLKNLDQDTLDMLRGYV